MVNKCPDTGQLFECDKEFKNYRARLLRERRAVDQRNKEIRDAKVELAAVRSLLDDPANIAQWFTDNQHRLMKLYMLIKQPTKSNSFFDGDVYKDIRINLLYSDHVANTHSCPENGVTNWGWQRQTNGLPTGYRGWQGRVSGKLDRNVNKYNYPTTDLLTFCGIHTGSGGGGNDSWGYGCIIFLDNWPSLLPFWEQLKQAQLIKKIIESGPRASI